MGDVFSAENGWRIGADPDYLRDHFAAAALPAVIQSCAGDPWAADYGSVEAMFASVEAMFASKAYSIADAMIEARKPKADA